MPSQKKRKRVPKESRQNLRLWAEGIRETNILAPHIEAYSDALERGWCAERECLQKICNEFHAKIDWRLPDHEEPQLPLPDYDPLVEEIEEELSEEEVAKRAHIAVLNARIRHWLKYRVRQLRKLLRTHLNPSHDPWALLLAKLCGVNPPPKARQAYHQFMHEKYQSLIAPVVAERWAESVGDGSNLQTKKDPDGPFRAKVAREMFAELSQGEQKEYATRAKEEAAEARKKFDEDLKKPPSKAPEDRQACIDRMGAFVGPILQGIYERTGLHSTILMGGPIPGYVGNCGPFSCRTVVQGTVPHISLTGRRSVGRWYWIS
ncbi:hypothetical protein C8R45DRAFT_1031174 [Mycena sanguinolenta]|nr:hypothetical protein C8R45DRAFT_1031174 [Mycena sanguinolenta]